GYLVQWTERERLEFHPEILHSAQDGTKAQVLLGLLGRELTRGLQEPTFQGSGIGDEGLVPKSSTPDPRPPPAYAHTSDSAYFPETRQAVSEPFLSYWRRN